MIEDPRKIGLKKGLNQLTLDQLYRVYEYEKEMVLDEFNYHDGKFCPLAVAVGLDETIEDPTHEKVFNELTSLGYSIYNTRGIKGEFYTTNRKEDLHEALAEVIKEKENPIIFAPYIYTPYVPLQVTKIFIPQKTYCICA